ncbi:Crp/Fnr family transcriptional regulator [Paenibacillus agri]|uniref:Cyclic nucleotide-binding domain-containing protein n=1 Tax=Paenibacillus agri TaxID=2744309 RepID=A0A850EWR8_9BACL|nr:cyclic nucleotide-binding domain-containing protein [Paenibacillus agri]NUU62301.1 cyclic nucleotide-binding domain-containing protein [Paenibacillus agri]
MERSNLLNVKEAIKKADLTTILPPEVTPFLRVQEYNKNEWIIVSGEKLNYLYIVIEGKGAIMNSSEEGDLALIEHLENKEMMGDFEYFTKSNFVHSVMASQPASVLLIPIEIVNDHLMKSADFLLLMCKSMSEKLMKSSIKNARSLLYPPQQKLCKFIVQASEHSKSNTIYFKHKDVANEIGISERHLRRMLNELIDEEIIRKISKQLTILDMELLRKYSSFI